MRILHRLWHEEDGVLSFEWTLLVTLLTIGVVGGLAAARDAVIDELGDVAQAAQGIDQSYSLSGISLSIDFDGPGGLPPFTATAAGSSFTEQNGVDNVFTDCGRTNLGGQAAVSDDPA
jgi:Flp pilus assembly pilin Flp